MSGWNTVDTSFDINDHILSLFLRKMRQLDGILHLFDTLHLTNVLAEADLASIFTLFDVEHNVRPIVLGRVCLYCGENIKCGIFFKCP